MDYPKKFSDNILPDQIHKINLSFIVNKFERRRGGTAGNASYALGLLKTPHKIFSYAGKDFNEYKRAFKKVGINTSHILIDKRTYTATGFAMTDQNHNQIWGYFYGGARKNKDLELKTIAGKGDLVLVGPSGTEASIGMIKQCITLGVDYIFDPGFILTEVDNENLELGVKYAKIVIGNDYEIEVIKDRIKDWQKHFATKAIVTTLGKEGSLINTPKEEIKINPAVVKKAVDPTGAGDAWRGGFLAGLERNFELKTCGQMGSVAAAFAVESYGTQGYKYNIEQFKKRYRQNYGDMLNL